MGGSSVPVRRLYSAALLVFLVTIVIGILNGLDLWDPPRTLLLTHVHAGTLGWITLAVFGVSVQVFGRAGDDRSADTLSWVLIGATALYLLAFATTTSLLRPLAGGLMLAAIFHGFSWATVRRASAPGNVSTLGLYLALVSLVIGAVLGVLLGIVVARGSVPGLGEELSGNLAGAHPPAMLTGYLILAGVSIIAWRLRPRPTSEWKMGVAVVWMLFGAGIVFNLAFILDVEALIQVGSLLQVIGVVTFAVSMRKELAPSAWGGAGHDIATRWAAVYLVVGVALLVYVVQLFVSGQLDPESGENVGPLVAFDHAFFIGMMTNVLLAVSARRAWTATDAAVTWAVNLSLLVFLFGLVGESAILKQISTPIMGVALIAAIFVRLSSSGAAEVEAPA